jgi:uncharacterized membrane protein YkvA (DUF1232 family)
MLRLLKLWRLTGRDLRLLWFALRHPSRPAWLWPAVLLLALYAIDPLNVVFPAAGLVDDAILIPLLLHGLVRLLPADIRLGFPR